jgi:lysophospholipase L1-like esterase
MQVSPSATCETGRVDIQEQPIAMKTRLLLLVFVLPVSCAPVSAYRDLPRVQAWEPTIAQFEELDRSTTYPDDAVLFAGSSSIRLWTSLAKDMAPYPVIQRGYGGARCCDFAVYADRILHPHRPRAIVLFIANDIAGGDLDKTPDEVLRLFRHIVATIRVKLPQTPVFWIAITPTESRWRVWPQIREVNRKIREYCTEHEHLHYIATEEQFLNEQGQPRAELFRADRLHLNAEGYRLWTKMIRHELDGVLRAP